MSFYTGVARIDQSKFTSALGTHNGAHILVVARHGHVSQAVHNVNSIPIVTLKSHCILDIYIHICQNVAEIFETRDVTH